MGTITILERAMMSQIDRYRAISGILAPRLLNKFRYWNIGRQHPARDLP